MGSVSRFLGFEDVGFEARGQSFMLVLQQFSSNHKRTMIDFHQND